MHTVETRKPLWDALSHIAPSLDIDPWLLMGDFNVVLHSSDRLNGAGVTGYDTHDFEQFLFKTGVAEIRATCHFLSWSNKGLGVDRVASRMDWALGNGTWMLQFDQIYVDYINPSISDHFPLLVHIKDDHKKGGRPFKFFNFLADNSQFEKVVTTDWHKPMGGTPLSGVWFKLKRLKAELKKLHSEEFAGITEKISPAQQELDLIQTELITNPADNHLQNDERILYEKLQKWVLIEESVLRQKARINWLQMVILILSSFLLQSNKEGVSTRSMFYIMLKE